MPVGSVKPTAIDAVDGKVAVSCRNVNVPSLLLGNVWLAAMLDSSTPAFTTCDPPFSTFHVARSTMRECNSLRINGKPAVPSVTPGYVNCGPGLSGASL